MNLRDRPAVVRKPAPAAAPEKEPAAPAVTRTRATPAERSYQELKLRIHRKLIDRIDLSNLGRVDMESADVELSGAISQLIEEEPMRISKRAGEQLHEEILIEVRGLGPTSALVIVDDGVRMRVL